MSVLSAPYFHDEAAAFAELEATLWPHGPVCPRCGGLDRITAVKGGRMGLRRCGPCKRQFTVTVGTVFESSHVPLNLWLQAVYLMCSSKKGVHLDLTAKVGERIDDALAVDDECEGALIGMLEQINIHQGANTFHIYPEVGPRKVTCHFPFRLYDDAISAVGKKVEVSGTLKYRAHANFPHQIAVSDIDAYAPESDLPHWDDLLGRAPDATGGVPSEAFVRELRDAWE